MTYIDTRLASIDTLTSSGSITDSHIHKLKNKGFETITDVAMIKQPMRLARSLGISSPSIINIIHVAQFRGKFVIRKGPLRLPRGYPIYFDIETDTKFTKIWLSGVVDGRNMEYKKFYSDTWLDEKQMLQDFGDYLNCRPNMPLYHFSRTNFDIRVTRQACIRYGLRNHPIFKHPHIDIFHVIDSAFYIPIKKKDGRKDMRLKSIAAFLGYDMTLEDRDDYMDGKECALHYEDHVNRGIPLNKTVFQYNKNDVYMLEFVLRRLSETCINR